jgi:hypothetical protein
MVNEAASTFSFVVLLPLVVSLFGFVPSFSSFVVAKKMLICL